MFWSHPLTLNGFAFVQLGTKFTRGYEKWIEWTRVGGLVFSDSGRTFYADSDGANITDFNPENWSRYNSFELGSYQNYTIFAPGEFNQKKH